MSMFDLNTLDGFKSITGGAAGLLQSFTGVLSNNWDIDEASYGHDGQQVLFHIFKTSANFNGAVSKVEDIGGRRKVPILFPYVDGQSTDDLGRMGGVYNFSVMIFGPHYKAQMKKLLIELDDPRPGTLVHPVLGNLTVVCSSVRKMHEAEQKQAVVLELRFEDHNFDVSFDTIPIAKDTTSALTAAIGFIALIDSLITKIESNLLVLQATRNFISALLSHYQDSYTATLIRLNQTFNSGKTVPGLTPVLPGQNPSTFNVVDTTNDAFAGTSSIQTQTQQSSQELSAALASQQATDQVKSLLTELASSIDQISAVDGGQGSLNYYDVILSMKESGVSIQQVLEFGLASSKNQIVAYKVPRDMSAREILFANGIAPDNQYDIEVLNPDLLSFNLIPKGTVVQVPT